MFQHIARLPAGLVTQRPGQVPVVLSGLRAGHLLGTASSLGMQVAEHYRLQTLVLVSRVVGSMPNLGNLLGLVSR